MASLPTGSDKLLEIQTGKVCVVIKSKNLHPNLTEQIVKQSSDLKITGGDIQSIKVLGEEKIVDNNGAIGMSICRIATSPLFFEQTDYEIVIRSTDGQAVAVWHENFSVRDRISKVTDKDDLISGIVNFGNSAGYSEFEIAHAGKRHLLLRIELFPSKISYKEDYQAMLQDINEEITGAVLDFMRSTYQELSIGTTQNTIPALFFEIIKQIFDKFQNAANMIVASPHHKLYVEHPIVPAHKVKKTDKHTLKWLQKHPNQVVPMSVGYEVAKAPTVKKQITYNTTENQFSKFILKSTVMKLEDFRERYERSAKNPEQNVLDQVTNMAKVLNKYINTTFLREVDDYKATQSMSLVFGMAPGYRELYKYYLMMQRGLSVHGDVFRMSMKDTAQLYEYWCFIKLVTIMKQNYKLVSSDVIKVDNTGVTITLVKGKKSEVKFVNPRTGEVITLAYNPGEHHTQTVNQKPDNVLSLEKNGASIPYKYVFDAKYRIENNPSDPYYPDDKPGPKVDDINTMHRYRDSIVYESDTPSRFMFEKTMFGAYVLFPYGDMEEYKNGVHKYGYGKEGKGHRFYNSIETVNIGGFPFMPGATELLEEFLKELVADSPESAFERASLPRGIEEKLAKVDWTVRDVMVGTVRTKEQLRFNIEKRGYYAPARFISEDQLPIKYIALHEEDIGNESGIKRYGEVLTVQKIRRGRIPVTMRKGADPYEQYYYFTVREWIDLPETIVILDSFRGKPQFTNKFLLDHCNKSYQLFAISSEEEYRLMSEINKAFDELSVSASPEKTAVYRVNEKHTVVVSDGYFTVADTNGEIIDKIAISKFAQRPRSGFKRIKDAVG